MQATSQLANKQNDFKIKFRYIKAQMCSALHSDRTTYLNKTHTKTEMYKFNHRLNYLFFTNLTPNIQQVAKVMRLYSVKMY